PDVHYRLALDDSLNFEAKNAEHVSNNSCCHRPPGEASEPRLGYEVGTRLFVLFEKTGDDHRFSAPERPLVEGLKDIPEMAYHHPEKDNVELPESFVHRVDVPVVD